LNDKGVFIVKIMAGVVHELAPGRFALSFWERVAGMGLQDKLDPINSTTFQGVAAKKEADSAFKPASRPLKTDWPTLVLECGLSESLARLRVDAHWWLENSVRDVKIVLLFSICATPRRIHLEQWEMAIVGSEHHSQTGPQP
ncbi:hypothetical protein C7212DRAFT_37301, partial [Tuber magnatum]